MGSYLNPGSKGFRERLNSSIYIDKSALIEKTNAVLNTRQKFLCVSRPRRFGKSMAADMLAAYYGRCDDSAKLFDGLMISQSKSYHEHLNQYDVIKINMQEFLSVSGNVDEIAQIKDRCYPNAIKDYHGNLLLAGINYDRKTKTHTCIIETVQKED